MSSRGSRSLYCSFIFPRTPGHSGGEIRDFHLLRRLLDLGPVEFFALHHTASVEQADPLGPRLAALHDPLSLGASRPRPIPTGLLPHWRRALDLARAWWGVSGLPGRRYHRDVRQHLAHARAHTLGALREALERRPPEFFFVSPQLNPVALALRRRSRATRFVLASYDVEALRLRRFADAAQSRQRRAWEREARRAQRFERDNLRWFDGVIAVSALDRERFVSAYGLAPQRVLVVDNGVDVEHFAFSERPPASPPHIVYVGSLAYGPNSDAAVRLLDDVMPRVWARRPDTHLTIVGQGPGAQLTARDDGARVRVVGRVADVRPYLARAHVLCVPLRVGSGTKLKVLESLSAGVPVVGTHVAAEGLELHDGVHLLVRESDQDLADAALALIHDPGLASRLARAGRARVEARYAWDANLAPLAAWLEALKMAPAR